MKSTKLFSDWLLDSHVEHKDKMSQNCLRQDFIFRWNALEHFGTGFASFLSWLALPPSLNPSLITIAVTYNYITFLSSEDKLLREMVMQMYVTWNHLEDRVEFFTLHEGWLIPEIQPGTVYPRRQSFVCMFPTKGQNELGPHLSAASPHL